MACVKVFRLRGDVVALKQAALARFSPSLLSKKALWDFCSVDDLTSLELPFSPRWSSEKRSQAIALIWRIFR